MRQSDARRLFASERARFARLFPHVADTQFDLVDRRCTDKGHCRFRDLAYADEDARSGAPRVVMLARALKLSDDNVLGLMLHELGHVADIDVSKAGREQRADDIARWVTGLRISYDGRNIQTVGPGRYPRPRNLHR